MDQSIAVAAWQPQLTESLPEELRGSLPTIEEIEAELAGDLPPESPRQRLPDQQTVVPMFLNLIQS